MNSTEFVFQFSANIINIIKSDCLQGYIFLDKDDICISFNKLQMIEIFKTSNVANRIINIAFDFVHSIAIHVIKPTSKILKTDFNIKTCAENALRRLSNFSECNCVLKHSPPRSTAIFQRTVESTAKHMMEIINIGRISF